MDGKTYGYARVSTKSQNEDRQVIALREYGIENHRILVEKQSGKDFDRPIYKRLLKKLKAGDTLVITSLDRLGRDYAEVQEQWRVISKERGVSIVVLDMPLLNTKETTELVSQLISDLVLGIFSFVAQTERENIRARQREGIEVARARGVRFGRPRLSVPEDFADMAKRWRRGEFTSYEAARNLGFSRSTFFRRVNEVEALSAALPEDDPETSALSAEQQAEPQEVPQLCDADAVAASKEAKMPVVDAANVCQAAEADSEERKAAQSCTETCEEPQNVAASGEKSIDTPVNAAINSSGSTEDVQTDTVHEKSIPDEKSCSYFGELSHGFSVSFNAQDTA